MASSCSSKPPNGRVSETVSLSLSFSLSLPLSHCSICSPLIRGRPILQSTMVNPSDPTPATGLQSTRFHKGFQRRQLATIDPERDTRRKEHAEIAVYLSWNLDIYPLPCIPFNYNVSTSAGSTPYDGHRETPRETHSDGSVQRIEPVQWRISSRETETVESFLNLL